MSRPEDAIENAVFDMLTVYEFPAKVHGDRQSIKLTANEAAVVVMSVIKTMDRPTLLRALGMEYLDFEDAWVMPEVIDAHEGAQGE